MAVRRDLSFPSYRLPAIFKTREASHFAGKAQGNKNNSFSFNLRPIVLPAFLKHAERQSLIWNKIH